MRPFIDQKTKLGVFDIGHKVAGSMTFMPQIFKREGDDLNTVYVDVAGTNDTSTKLTQLVNVFVIQRIFQIARTVRFLVPMTHNSVTD